MVAFYIYSNLWNLEKCVQRAAFSSYFLVDKELAMPENSERGNKIFKSLAKLFEPQRKFVYDGKLAHQSQIPTYIGFSLSDTLNELPVLLTAAQIILWWLSVQLGHQQNFETFLAQHHLHAQSSQISSLDPKFNANCNFSCVVLLFTYWALTAEPLVGRILPFLELCAAAGASRDAAAPLPAARKCWDGAQEIPSPCSGGRHPNNDTLKYSFYAVVLFLWTDLSREVGGLWEAITAEGWGFRNLQFHPFLWDLRAQAAAKHL